MHNIPPEKFTPKVQKFFQLSIVNLVMSDDIEFVKTISNNDPASISTRCAGKYECELIAQYKIYVKRILSWSEIRLKLNEIRFFIYKKKKHFINYHKNGQVDNEINNGLLATYAL